MSPKIRRSTLVQVPLAGVLALSAACAGGGTGTPQFRTQAVDRGDVTASVTATGSLSALTTVKVGSQVSGIVAALHADFNSVVKTGQLLAELDTTPFEAIVEQRKADVQRARADLRNATLVATRDKRLLDEQILSQGEYDAAAANQDGARAAVRQAQAGLDQANANLGYTKITSPIDGVVVDRQYDVGQTVAASFQAPVLFTIAQDMTKMQVLTNLDESDVGGVKEGQPATFTVDAFPDDTFHGTVAQVRLSPQTVQNVVTYPVVINVDNLDLRLKPGMTANVQIPVDSRTGVLRVPNAALRFKPDPAFIEAPPAAPKEVSGASGPDAGAPATGDSAAQAPGGAPRGDSGGGWPRGGRGGAGGWPGGAGRRGGTNHQGTIYLLVGKTKVRAVAVRTSLTDGTYTAVFSKDLKEGDPVVVALETTKASSTTGARPPMGGPGMGGPRGPRF